MYYTYVLLCKGKDREKMYFGFTGDLKLRIGQYRKKMVKTTRSFNEIELIYYESCRNKTDARKREIQLKTGFGRGYLKRRLENDIKN